MKFRKYFKAFEGKYVLDFTLRKHVNLEDQASRRNGEIGMRTRFLLQPCCIGVEEITNKTSDDDKQKSILISCSMERNVYVWYLNGALRFQEEKPLVDLNPKGGTTSCSALHAVESKTVMPNNTTKRKEMSIDPNENMIFEFLIGFNTGDIVLYNIKTKQQTMFNKEVSFGLI